ncbi:MAG: alpha/beta hydrolase [Cyclobacteriaceae bacterium]
MKIAVVLALFFTSPILGQELRPSEGLPIHRVPDLAYKTQGDAYEMERCRLDLYLPDLAEDFPLLIWLHGGGLTINSKDSLEASEVGVRMAREGIGTAVINYRLSPEATFPAYIDDVAAAIQWVYDNARKYQGDRKRLFVGGHSAGAYLAAMVALDPTYLESYDLKPRRLTGVIAISGQMDSHQTTKKERNLPAEEKIVDQTAPLFFVSEAQKLPPFLILYADHDMPQRGAINREFVDSLQAHQYPVMAHEIKDRDHLSIIRNVLQPDDETVRLMKAFILGDEIDSLNAE